MEMAVSRQLSAVSYRMSAISRQLFRTAQFPLIEFELCSLRHFASRLRMTSNQQLSTFNFEH